MNTDNAMNCFECGGNQFLALDDEKKVCLQCGKIISPYSRVVNKKSIVNKDKEKIAIKNPIRSLSLLDIWEQSVRITNSHEKNIVTALTEITRLGDHFHISSKVLEDASNLYRRLIEKRHIKRYKIEALAAAVFYISCRNNGKQLSMSNIEKASNISRKELAKSIRLFIKELNIKIDRRKQSSPRYPSCFNMNHRAIVNKIIETAIDQKFTTGKNPDSITAAACYITGIITGAGYTQRMLAEYYGITQTTIRNQYKKLEGSLLFTHYV